MGQSYLCNLSEENIKVGSWLKLFANVKEMTLPAAAIGFILEVLYIFMYFLFCFWF